MFGSLRKKLSKRSSNPMNDASANSNAQASTQQPRSGGFAPPQDNNPFSSSPATRRPSNYTPVLATSSPDSTDSKKVADRSSMNPFSSSSDAPPAYTPGPAQNAGGFISPIPSADSDNDPYAFLKTFDTVFVIDDSGSMAGRSWRETGKALEMITPICTQRDADGIDIYFLNHPDSTMYRNVTSAGTIIEIFQSVRPGGATPTGQRLHKILKPYLERYEKHPESTKPINIIVITDGVPTDDVESPIISAAKKLDKFDAPAWQVGIQFFQVGRDPDARDALKALDDELGNVAGDSDLRDIVDTVPFTGTDNAELSAAGIMKVVSESIQATLWRHTN